MNNQQRKPPAVRRLNRKAIHLCLLGAGGLFGLAVAMVPSPNNSDSQHSTTPSTNSSHVAAEHNIPGFLKNLPDAYPVATPKPQQLRPKPRIVPPAMPVQPVKQSPPKKRGKKKRAEVQHAGLFFPGASRLMGHAPKAAAASANAQQRKPVRKTAQRNTIPIPNSLPEHLIPLANENSVYGNRDDNGHVQKHLFLGKKNNSVRILKPSPGRYAIMEGSFLPAVLETHMNSDLPGPIKARLQENIYDTKTGQHLLIPQGSTLIGEYNSVVGHTQQRAQVVWTRLILPNTRSINLMRMPAMDARGSIGKKAQVNHHYDKLVSAILMTSLMSAGASQTAKAGEGLFVQNFQNNLQASIQQAGQKIAQRQLAAQPTLELKQGTSLQVFATADLLLVPYEY